MSAWNIDSYAIPGRKLRRSPLDPRKDHFPSHIPNMHTYDRKSVPATPGIMSRLRANDEDRVKRHNISLLNRLIQRELPPEDSIAKGCDVDSSTSKISALVHQDFIQRYLTTDTPERGLLVYHGLGSGKTATSIAVIEANRSKKKVIVMIPASLQDNYVQEILKIGPVLFGRGTASLRPYEWYFHRIDPERYESIAEESNVPLNVIDKLGGLFRIVPPGETDESDTWDDMTKETRENLSYQLTETLLSQIVFVRYNGLSYSDAYALNLNNATVVIDEVHNISRMVRNKQEGIGRILYQKIRDATNSKIVALSGTPLVNSPFEVAILANMIHGASPMSRVPFVNSRSGESASDQSVIRELYLDPIVRYANIIPSEKAGGGSELLILRHPEGFESLYSGKTYVGIIRTDRGFTKDPKWLDSLRDRLRPKGITLQVDKSSITQMLWFPESEETFLQMYTQKGEEGTDGFIKYKEQLLRRLMVVSYYRGADPIKYPRTRDIQVIRTEMNDRQFDEYSRARFQEIDQSRKSSTKQGGGGGGESDDVFTGRYRTRQLCSVYFPSGRPTRDVVKRELELRGIIGEDEVNEEYTRRLDIIMNELRATPDLRANIAQYSPKYQRVLDILDETEGLALFYSSFLRMEGLETIQIFMESDGYMPFEIVMDTDGKTPRIKGIMDESMREKFIRIGGRKFMVFSGAVEKEARAYLIRIFRGDFKGLPESLREDLRMLMGESYKEDSTANLRGEVCRVLMITGAGAEGLNLKAVRQVHVLEPYWNQARLDQVFGRAVRVCSHADLDDSERDVERYLHVCGFPKDLYHEMITRGDNRFLEAKDRGMSTDEYLADLSRRKSMNNVAFLDLMKRAAVDCTLHASENGFTLNECMSMPNIDSEDRRIGISPDYRDDADENEYREELRDTIIVQIGRSIIRNNGVEIETGPKIVAVDYRSMNAYDADMIVIRKLVRVGHVEFVEEGDATIVTLVLEQDPVVLDGDLKGASVTLGVPPGAPPGVSPGSPPAGVEGGLGDRVGRAVGGVPVGVRYEVIGEDEQGEYREYLSELSEELREQEITKLVNTYTRELSVMMYPTEIVRAKVFVLVMGHPGSGKTHFTQELLDGVLRIRNPEKIYPFITRNDKREIVSIPMTDRNVQDYSLEYDNYARVGVDEILTYMREYQERFIVRDEGMVRKIDPRVIGDKTIRDIANKISQNLLNNAMDLEIPIIYETTFANPKNVVNNILKVAIENGYISQIHEGEGGPKGAMVASSGGGGVSAPSGSLIVGRDGSVKAMGSVKARGSEPDGALTPPPPERVYAYDGQLVVFNFYNRNLRLTKERVQNRFAQEGRFMKIDGTGFSVENLWKELKDKRKNFRELLTAKGRSRYKLDIPVDLYIEIDTTDERNAKVDYKNAVVGLGFIRGEGIGELSSEELRVHD